MAVQAVRIAKGLGGLHRNSPRVLGAQHADEMISKLFNLREGGTAADRAELGGTLPEFVEWAARNTPKFKRVGDAELRRMIRRLPAKDLSASAGKFRYLVASEDNAATLALRKRLGIEPLKKLTGGDAPDVAVFKLRDHLRAKVQSRLERVAWYEDIPDRKDQLEQIERVVREVVGTDPQFKKYVRAAMPGTSARTSIEAAAHRPVGAPIKHTGDLLKWYNKRKKEYREAVKNLGAEAAKPLDPGKFSDVVERSLERGRAGMSPFMEKRRDSYEKAVRALALQYHYGKATQTPVDLVKQYLDAGMLKSKEDVGAAILWAKQQRKHTRVPSMPAQGMERILDDYPSEGGFGDWMPLSTFKATGRKPRGPTITQYDAAGDPYAAAWNPDVPLPGSGRVMRTGGWRHVEPEQVPRLDPHEIIAAHRGKMPPEMAWAEAQRRRRALSGDQMWDPSVSEWMSIDDLDFQFASDGDDWRDSMAELIGWRQDQFSPAERDPWAAILGGEGPTKPGAVRPPESNPELLRRALLPRTPKVGSWKETVGDVVRELPPTREALREIAKTRLYAMARRKYGPTPTKDQLRDTWAQMKAEWREKDLLDQSFGEVPVAGTIRSTAPNADPREFFRRDWRQARERPQAWSDAEMRAALKRLGGAL